MKGGRLRIVNESSYPTGEVERLVRFGLDEIRLPGDGLVAVVKNTKQSKRRARGQSAYSGTAYSLAWGIRNTLYDRYIGRRKEQHIIIMRIGAPECFPTRRFRKYAGVDKVEYADWKEALVAITAHEGTHIQHAHDGAYKDTEKSGRRTITWRNSLGQAIGKKIVNVRVGVERIEPKCEAFEAYMLRRYRREQVTLTELAAKGGESMPRVIVQTDDGVEVWRMNDVPAYAVLNLQCQGNVRGSSVAAGIRRATSDAEKIQRGEDPERPSEKAIRLMHEERERSGDVPAGPWEPT